MNYKKDFKLVLWYFDTFDLDFTPKIIKLSNIFIFTYYISRLRFSFY